VGEQLLDALVGHSKNLRGVAHAQVEAAGEAASGAPRGVLCARLLLSCPVTGGVC
jgi:hypothetical protein